MSYMLAVESLFARGHELARATDSSGVKTTPVRRKFALTEMRTLASALGNPEQTFRSVLIAGTNGKGSTAAMLASILRAAGHRTGLYTSPHLSRVNERIQIDGAAISDHDFARLYFRVDEAGAHLLREGKIPQGPSFFEAVTAVALLYFAEQEVDLAVLEVGMGGRLDATNIVEPLVSIVTDISLDHTEWLGTTIADIAREKAGILRPGGTMVTLPQHPEANQALGEAAIALGVKGVSAVEYMPPQHAAENEAAWGATYSVIALGETVQLAPALAGTHQHRNMALAVAAAVELCNSHDYIIDAKQIAAGIGTTHWPGRLEFFPPSASRCAVLLDVAHNPAGVWTLRAALGAYEGAGTKRLLFGCLLDKAVQEMAQILFPVFDRVLLTPVDSPRSASAEELLAIAHKLGTPAEIVASAEAGLVHALQRCAPDDLLVCAGSIYLVGPVRTALLSLGATGQ
ncbi:MAG: bifunctional folylpolyglutamate synthase/dihydrofolate synthase [Acidobacteriaceae bacterium]